MAIAPISPSEIVQAVINERTAQGQDTMNQQQQEAIVIAIQGFRNNPSIAANVALSQQLVNSGIEKEELHKVLAAASAEVEAAKEAGEESAPPNPKRKREEAGLTAAAVETFTVTNKMTRKKESISDPYRVQILKHQKAAGEVQDSALLPMFASWMTDISAKTLIEIARGCVVPLHQVMKFETELQMQEALSRLIELTGIAFPERVEELDGYEESLRKISNLKPHWKLQQITAFDWDMRQRVKNSNYEFRLDNLFGNPAGTAVTNALMSNIDYAMLAGASAKAGQTSTGGKTRNQETTYCLNWRKGKCVRQNCAYKHTCPTHGIKAEANCNTCPARAGAAVPANPQ